MLNGGAGDDVLIGGPGDDVLDGGGDDDIVIQLVGDGSESSFAAESDTVSSARVAGQEWLEAHVSIVDGKTVLDVGGKQHTLPGIDLSQLVTSSG